MGASIVRLASALPFGLLLWGLSGPGRVLTYEQRLDAQTAIERVYYSHQIGATLPFEEAVPQETIMRKVATYIRETLVLEERWHTKITPDMLDAETSRITTGTQLPERLREVFEALGDDSFLIQETFVRAELVDRLAREAFAADPTIHAEARARAEALRDRLTTGDLGIRTRYPDRTVMALKVAGGPAATGMEFGGAPDLIPLDAERFARWRSLAPEQVGAIGPIVEEPGAFVIRAVLAEEPGMVRIATWTVAKTTWDEWWATLREGIDADRFVSVARPRTSTSLLSLNTASHSDALGSVSPGSCATSDSWAPISTQDAPQYGEAVWSGQEMIVWDDGAGGRYAPLADAWTPASLIGSPGQRYGHTMIWTGNVLTVWGGLGIAGYLDTGGRYDPVTDTWTPTSTFGAPAPRFFHSAVWTGSEMIVWAGGIFNSDDEAFEGLVTGGRYDPIGDTWISTPTIHAPAGRLGHTAVWTGSQMIVWGGRDSLFIYHDTGGKLDPATGGWTDLATSGAPEPRWLHASVWTGREMIVWGGAHEDLNTTAGTAPLVTGGRYDPVADRWRPTSTNGAPEPRWEFTSVWTGQSMVVWGGSVSDRSHCLDTGGAYDPAGDKWSATSTRNAPEPRSAHSAVWTGREMLIWGGRDRAALNTGGRYSPVSSTDADGDGYTVCDGDCDDANSGISPVATDLPGNSIDENCDGTSACDPGARWKNRGAYVRCVERECAGLVSSGKLTRAQCGQIVKKAKR
ncbi:MAG TPA: MopE-related protein [Patescibacteria group bacterium]|nr:MopE-related protein [Patescibacteria group bacterium]